ncbi:hypothetical protein [Pyrobaculum neutrophilum]|uniref:Uncharacterized protein n=1 Tax=Pyrobaculum neutrophilum (strain DSM 2338 / JCM 9278 / NBRC 100436 / V24Sta) TaxID=444157 RepID=B1Y970_PYRNV|nr:hypothetical protein [Pyrobaculum neutrophilum]ACB40299.1 conserved hypothetical protein [Pyrobaculum neutrophilum V24Sta]
MECDVVLSYLKERGVAGSRRRLDFVAAVAGSLQIGFWCPREDFPNFDDIEDARKTLDLDHTDVLVVVAYRPYVIVDYLNSLMERASRWYGVQLHTKLLGVSSVELETGLEEALGRAFVEKPNKLGTAIKTEYVCPHCGRDALGLYRQERYFSRKYRGRVIEGIYACASCGFKIRRVELLD